MFMDNYNDLLTIDQIAYELRVTRRTVHNWLKAGVAPLGVTIQKKHYFFKSALKHFQKPGQGKRNDLARTN